MVARTHPERLQHARGVVRQRVLGIAAGLTGVYLLLRKRALLGDAISHATLPGVAAMFLFTILVGLPKSLPLLLLGAAISGSLGGLTVLGLRHWLRIREDAALGIVLSVFFGAGVALTGTVVRLPAATQQVSRASFMAKLLR